MRMELISACLGIMGRGMLGIFLVILCFGLRPSGF